MIIANGSLIDELINDGRFRMIKRWANSDVSGGQIVDGAVFHISAATKNDEEKQISDQ